MAIIFGLLELNASTMLTISTGYKIDAVFAENTEIKKGYERKAEIYKRIGLDMATLGSYEVYNFLKKD